MQTNISAVCNTNLPIDVKECTYGDVVKSDGFFPCAISEIGTLQNIVSDEEREKMEFDELEKEIEEEFANESI